MATALQRQLATIAASSTHQLDLRAQKAAHGKSLLFEPRVAAAQSFENLYLLCLDGFRDLCALDPRFAHFSKSLFSEQSKVEDRTQMTRDENSRLDTVIEAFITLVGPRLLLRPAEKALEWLVRRFKVHEYNTECLVLTYLPYHGTPQFLSLLSILSAMPPAALRFLHPYIQSPTNPPRRTIVYTAINTPAFFRAYQAYLSKVVTAGHQGSQLLSFWASITVEAIPGILNNANSGRKGIQDQKMEELVLELLPVLNTCMQAKHGSETVEVCYTIVLMLVSQAKVGDRILDGLLEAVVVAHDEQTVNSCLACLAVIAGERSKAQIPARICKKILKIPQIFQKLLLVSERCQIGRLTLGCALGALTLPNAKSDDEDSLFFDLCRSSIMTEAQLRIVLSSLLLRLQNATLGSEEHGRLLALASKLTESDRFLRLLQDIGKENQTDWHQLGLSMDMRLDPQANIEADSDDEEMVDIDNDMNSSQTLAFQIPAIKATSMLTSDTNKMFTQVAGAFEQAVAAHQTRRFLCSSEFHHQQSTGSDTLLLSFLSRVWCSTRAVSVRMAALRAATTSIKEAENANTLQNLLPYIICALADPSPLIRRSAATLVGVLAGKPTTPTETATWGSNDMYHKLTKNIVELKGEDFETLLSSMLVPILEESVIDAHFVVPALRDMLESPQASKTRPQLTIKSQVRTSILSFFASHASLCPILSVQLCLLPLFSFSGKVSDTARNSFIIPLIRRWCSLSSAEVEQHCKSENMQLEDAERGHVAILLPREVKSVQLFQDILSGGLSRDRTTLVNITFDRISFLWTALKSDFRLALAQALLALALKESKDTFDKLCRERALEVLRNAQLDSTILLAFLDGVPAPVQMPEGPPTKKRRRTSRNEMARVESSSPHDVQQLLRHLTLVLELIESSNPGQHLILFKTLFNMFGELQPLKQQADSELVYLQSMILGSLTPMVNNLKAQADTAEYQNAVRADLLIDCIRHSTSPQVQNSALLLISNLASWVPDLILHNLMPIFTFIGSTLLRQQDDYSAQVVDKTISRVVPQLAASLRAKHRNFLVGVSDLLLSFTAAFEHIPLHRRLKLFSELARTLGPEDSLSAIIALLADRYHSNKTHQKFSIDLLVVFDPASTLDAIKGYLDLIVDAAGTKPKISDTLFSLSEKQPAQIDSTIKNLLSCLVDLIVDERIRSHVGKAFRRREGAARPQGVFASIIETTIELSRQSISSPKNYELCGRVLAKCLDLLPTSDLIKTAELLLRNNDLKVQVAAVKAVELRAGSIALNDGKSVVALLSFLPSLDQYLHEAREIDAKLVSISCVDRIVERFGKKDVSVVGAIARTISGSHSLAESDDRIRILSLLCLTSVIDVLEDEAIDILPTVMPRAFQYLSQSIEDGNTGLHNAVLTLLSNVVERLGYMFSREYLETTLKLLHRSAMSGMDDSCDDSRHTFTQSISEHLAAHEIFAALKSTWSHAIAQGFDVSVKIRSPPRSSTYTPNRLYSNK